MDLVPKKQYAVPPTYIKENNQMLKSSLRRLPSNKLDPLIVIPTNTSNSSHPLNIKYFPSKRNSPLLATIAKNYSPEEEYIFAVIAISNAYTKAIILKEKYLPPIEELIHTHPHSLQQPHLQKKTQLIRQSLNDSSQVFFQKSLPSDINHPIENLEELFCSFLSKLALYENTINHLTHLIDCYITNPNHDLIRYAKNWQSRTDYLLKQFFPSIIAETKYIIQENYIIKPIPLKANKATPLFF